MLTTWNDLPERIRDVFTPSDNLAGSLCDILGDIFSQSFHLDAVFFKRDNNTGGSTKDHCFYGLWIIPICREILDLSQEWFNHYNHGGHSAVYLSREQTISFPEGKIGFGCARLGITPHFVDPNASCQEKRLCIQSSGNVILDQNLLTLLVHHTTQVLGEWDTVRRADYHWKKLMRT